MQKLSKRKKAFLILSTCIIFLTSPKVRAKESISINYNEDYQSTLEFASYGNTRVFIGKSELIDKIRDDNTNDIYIKDQRNLTDSNMSICNSYEIRDKDEMNTILDIILEYERRYPSDWNRTKKSMLNEWIAHNICYDLNLQRRRTMEVDLDNNDEEKYSLFIK